MPSAKRHGPYIGNNSTGVGLGPKLNHSKKYTSKNQNICSVSSALPKVPISQKRWHNVFRKGNIVGAHNDQSSHYIEKKHVKTLCKTSSATKTHDCSQNMLTTSYVRMKDQCPISKDIRTRSSSEQLYHLKSKKVCFSNDPVLKRFGCGGCRC